MSQLSFFASEVESFHDLVIDVTTIISLLHLYENENVVFACLFLQGLLGTVQYGVHVNGYYTDENGNMFMWLARRSPTKQTWPGKLDQIVRSSHLKCRLHN